MERFVNERKTSLRPPSWNLLTSAAHLECSRSFNLIPSLFSFPLAIPSYNVATATACSQLTFKMAAYIATHDRSVLPKPCEDTKVSVIQTTTHEDILGKWVM